MWAMPPYVYKTTSIKLQLFGFSSQVTWTSSVFPPGARCSVQRFIQFNHLFSTSFLAWLGQHDWWTCLTSASCQTRKVDAWLTTRPKRNTAKVKQMAVAFSTYPWGQRPAPIAVVATTRVRYGKPAQWRPANAPTVTKKQRTTYELESLKWTICLAIVVLSGVLKPMTVPQGCHWCVHLCASFDRGH